MLCWRVTSPYLANISPYLATKDSRKSPSPMLCQWGYRDLQVLAICLAQVLAGRRINFEGLAFAGKAILRQNTSDPVICQLLLLFLLNNSKIFGKGLIIPLTRGALGSPVTFRGKGVPPPPLPSDLRTNRRRGVHEAVTVMSQPRDSNVVLKSSLLKTLNVWSRSVQRSEVILSLYRLPRPDQG